MASLPVIAGQEMDEGLEEMWHGSSEGIRLIDAATENWRNQKLPLAKIKKIMKSEDVILQELERDRLEKLAAEEGQTAAQPNEKSTKFMISGEAPVLMSKACELMIKDLSFRAWRHTERNRRRTLQKQDLHAAVGESEVYDFLIDIVPRVTTTTPKIQHTHTPHLPASASVQGNTILPPTIPVGMQIAAGVPVGIPAALSQQTTQSTAVIDPNAGMMLMGSAQQQHPQHQHQTSAAFHQDPSQQILVGGQQQLQVPPSMHPQVVQQQQQHMQQTFGAMPPLPATAGQPVPAGASVAVSTMAGAAVAYDPNLSSGTTSNVSTTITAQADPAQWSSGVDTQGS